eukprot:gene22290-29366_t
MGCGSSSLPARETTIGNPQASTNKRHQIFLSYRKNDCGRLGAGDKTAILLKSKLVEFGWTQCDALVAVISKTYGDSVWCKSEVKMAMGMKKLIIPLWHSGPYPPTSMALSLASFQSIPSAHPFEPTDIAMLAEKVNEKMLQQFVPLEQEAAFHQRLIDACNNGDSRTVVTLVKSCAAIVNTRYESGSMVNDAGAAVARGTEPGCTGTYFCARTLSIDETPAYGDGQCGPNGGPQCAACKRFQDKAGNTALIRAALHGHVDNVIALLEKGAHVDALNNFGSTAYSEAKTSEIKELLKAYMS